jgi:hypothetical protein
MEPKMIKFPSIEQSRQVLPNIIRDAQFTHIDAETKTPCYDNSAPLPVLEFRGSVKLHGSNAAIVQTTTSATGESIHFQSRERILTVGNDLVGFCAYMSGKTKAVALIFESLSRSLKHSGDGSEESEKELEAIAVFGEWCGMGIQKGVALSKLPKMFVIFAVKVVYQGEDTPAEWLDMSKLAEVKDEGARIFNIMQFPTFTIVIDFNAEEGPAEAKKKMDELTLGVEEECPVGKHFGVSGTGEGIVWQAIQSPSLPVFKSGRYTDSRFWFKTKGAKHACNRKSEPNNKPSVSPETTAKVDSFVELVLTPGRLQQGLQVLERELLLPIEMKSVGAFMKWVNGDVMKEEYDKIEEAGIDKKTLPGPISAAAKKWYINQLECVKLECGMKTLTLGT